MDQTKETITLKRDKNSSFPLNRSPIEELIATDEAMRAWKHQYSREDTSEEIEMMGYQDKLLSTLDWIIETESAKHEPTSSTDLEPCDETDISPNLTVHERVAPEQSDDNEGIIPEISNAKTNCFNLNPRKHNKVSSDDDLDFDIGSYIGKAYKSELELFLRDSEDGQTKATEETTMYDPFSEECNLRPAQTYNVQLHSRDIDEDESQVSNSFELLQSTFAEHFFQHDSFALSQFAESMSGVSHDESLISGPFDLSHLPSDLEFTV